MARTRKPAPLEFAGGKSRRQRVWEAIRRLHARGDEAMTDATVHQAIPRAERADVELDMLRDYRRCLVAGGVLEIVTPGRPPRVETAYRLARDGGLEAPRYTRGGRQVTQGLAQEQVWRTLRVLGAADTNARELAAHASTPAVPVAEVAVRDYLRRLHAAGYLTLTRAGHGIGAGGVPARYRLDPARNTGPRPPMVCRAKVVYDPNENRVVYVPPVSEEDAIYGRQ